MTAGVFIKLGLWVVSGLLFLACALLFLYQCLIFLKTGAWPPVSVLHGIIELQARIGSDPANEWLLSPTEWIGVHRLLEWSPLTLALGAGAVAGAATASAVDPSY